MMIATHRVMRVKQVAARLSVRRRGFEEVAMVKAYPALVLIALALCLPAAARGDPQQDVQRYREMVQEGNPSELTEAKGEELWRSKRGPKNASLEQCDLGLGAGKVKGAYVRLPRYFGDTDRVQDVESRLVTLQGFTAEEAKKNPFSDSAQSASVMEMLAAWIASESRGMTIAPTLTHVKEQQAYRIGERIFYYRAGTHDFGCVGCHGEDNKRIRVQRMPNFNNMTAAAAAFGPVFRVKEGVVRTLQWRMWDCFRQARFPELEYTSDVSIALMVFLAKKAEGGTFNSPAVKF
jgi:sulfur-oxidizing protein SoxA